MIRSDPGILLGALEVAKLRKTTREKINTALLNARHEDLLYGMIVAEGRLVSVIRPRRHSLHPAGKSNGDSGLNVDMQLLFSMVFNSSSLLNGNEHWIPLCLPKFNAKGFLHAYIWAQASIAIILISADKNAFFNMRTVKEKVLEHLEKSGIWNKILSVVQRGRYTTCITPLSIDVLTTSGCWRSRYCAFHLQVKSPSPIYYACVSCERTHGETSVRFISTSACCRSHTENTHQDFPLFVKTV